MTFGLTPEGFNTPRLADLKTAFDNAYTATFGDINTASQSVAGQNIGILSKFFADMWENLEDIYFSQYPNSASGVALDNVCQLNGITRLAATQTVVIGTCAGTEGTTIPANAIAKIPSTDDNFYARDGGIITQSSANIVKIQVTALTAQIYTIVLNGLSYIYSKPIITFSNIGDIFVTGNIISVKINGVTLADVPFNTDSNTTLSDIATAIQAFDSSTVCTATPTNPNIISIIPLSGKSVTINSISITGGATQASYIITYDTPASENEVTAALTAILNVGTPEWIATDNMDTTLTVSENLESQTFSCLVGVSLAISYLASPIVFVSDNFGPVACPVGNLTLIVTPIGGWDTITNQTAGSLGRLIETDAELRIRRQNSIKLLGAGTVEAIRAQLLQNVSGVLSASVIENVTLQQLDIIVSFPDQFQVGDTITVTYNGGIISTVLYNTDQATTMSDLVTEFETFPGVSSASYGGTGNQILTVSMNVASVLTVDSVTTDVSALTAIITGGRPPKSFEAVVEGGENNDIASKIWETKPAGIETFGNTSVTIKDSEGHDQTIFFSRPSEIFIWAQVALTLYSEETFPTNGTVQVADAILAYGESLGVGTDVLIQRVNAQIFSVPGIASGSMQLASTISESETPVYGTSDITIDEIQISTWDLARITVTVV